MKRDLFLDLDSKAALPLSGLSPDELIVDCFAGGGGASVGIEMALGRSPDIAINHDAEAVAMHAMNHPQTTHHIEDVWDVNPRNAVGNKRVGLLWASPDCTFHSKARGGKPHRDRNRARRRRGLPWLMVRWAEAVRPRCMVMENVEEISAWGPLLKDGRPDPTKKGFTFRRFIARLENLGYEVQYRELRACDYGAPTTRKRLFLIARCDGQPIVWPQPTHGPGRPFPYITAAECIDWSLECPSIFERKKPLAENTLRRVARGIDRFVINNPDPFIVSLTHQGGDRVESIHDPLKTVTCANRGEKAVVQPHLVRVAHAEEGPNSRRRGKGEHPLEQPVGTLPCSNEFALAAPFVTKFRTGSTGSELRDPLPTITAGPKENPAGAPHALGMVIPTLVQTGYGERPGQAPRVPGLDKPLGTVVDGQKHALVHAFLAKHNGGHEATGSKLSEPIHTVTSKDHHSLITSNIVKLKGTCKDGQKTDEPLHTVAAQGTHFAEVRALLIKFYSTGGQWQSLKDPMHTIPTVDRMGLVTVRGEDYAIVDIGLRMLQPHELFKAQGFPSDYIFDFMYKGKRLSKSAQVRMCGNSVSPPVAAAIIRAQFAVVDERQEAVAA
jgi:DNA (cytosine-5)-methyltransferase 1